jgi:hypothetical protein
MDDLIPENVTTEEEMLQAIAQLETQMREAAKKFEFERAAALRDRIRALQQRELGGLLGAPAASVDAPVSPASPVPEPPAMNSKSVRSRKARPA